MNGRRAKLVRKIARNIQVDWINSLLPEGNSVTIETLNEAMPTQKYFMKGRTLHHSFMSNKYVEKLVKKNMNLTFKDLNTDNTYKVVM